MANHSLGCVYFIIKIIQASPRNEAPAKPLGENPRKLHQPLFVHRNARGVNIIFLKHKYLRTECHMCAECFCSCRLAESCRPQMVRSGNSRV